MSTACMARTLAAAISSSGEVCNTAAGVAGPSSPPDASASPPAEEAKKDPRSSVSPAATAAAASSAFWSNAAITSSASRATAISLHSTSSPAQSPIDAAASTSAARAALSAVTSASSSSNSAVVASLRSKASTLCQRPSEQSANSRTRYPGPFCLGSTRFARTARSSASLCRPMATHSAVSARPVDPTPGARTSPRLGSTTWIRDPSAKHTTPALSRPPPPEVPTSQTICTGWPTYDRSTLVSAVGDARARATPAATTSTSSGPPPPPSPPIADSSSGRRLTALMKSL